MGLSSNASMNTYGNNTLSSFRSALPASVVLDDSWEVELSDNVHPSSFNNVEGKFEVYWPYKKMWEQGCEISTGRYQTASDSVLPMEAANKQQMDSEYVQ